MPNGIIPQGGGAQPRGAPGFSGPLVNQLQDIGKPLISKATQTQTGGPPLDLSSLLMMLYFMGVFEKGKPPGQAGQIGESGLPGQNFGINSIMEILKGAMPQMGAGPTFPGR
jgi:hypothetical protein